MTVTLIISALLLGVGGSLHCLGMCGPLVLAMPFQTFAKGGQMAAITLYNAGRIMAYTFLGVLVYYFGAGMNWLGVSSYLSVALGILILLHLLLQSRGRILRIPFAGKFTIWQSQMLGKLMGKKGLLWMFGAGFLNGLLPCGLVYIALSAALATNTELPAFYFMVFFGAGTVPALATLAFLGQRISIGARMKLRRLTPIISAVVAILLVVRGLGLGIPMLSPKMDKTVHGTEVNCCPNK